MDRAQFREERIKRLEEGIALAIRELNCLNDCQRANQPGCVDAEIVARLREILKSGA